MCDNVLKMIELLQHPYFSAFIVGVACYLFAGPLAQDNQIFDWWPRMINRLFPETYLQEFRVNQFKKIADDESNTTHERIAAALPLLNIVELELKYKKLVANLRGYNELNDEAEKDIGQLSFSVNPVVGRDRRGALIKEEIKETPFSRIYFKVNDFVEKKAIKASRKNKLFWKLRNLLGLCGKCLAFWVCLVYTITKFGYYDTSFLFELFECCVIAVLTAYLFQRKLS